MLIDVCLCSVAVMSSSKRKLVGDKSSSDEKCKPSVFDRLGPSRANEAEVKCFMFTKDKYRDSVGTPVGTRASV